MQFDLVFEGGGAKGVAFVGAIQEFEARGHKARRFVGTSAGDKFIAWIKEKLNAKAP